MKTSLFTVLLIVTVLCGCSTYRDAWRTNGNLQVNIQAPADMSAQPAIIYVDGKAVTTTTSRAQTISLLPKQNTIKVEMAGTKPFQQTIEIAGNGSSQVLDVTLARQ